MKNFTKTLNRHPKNHANKPSVRHLTRNLYLLLSTTLLGLTACQETPTSLATHFDAVPTELTVGDSVTLSWRGAGTAACTLTTGQRSVTPKNCDQGEITERYDQAGTFLTALLYTESGTTHSQEVEVTVRAAENGFTAVQDGLSVNFSAPENISENTLKEAAFTWDFGDGQTGSGAHVTHRYALAGEYLVTLTQTQAEQKVRSSQKITAVVNSSRRTLFSGNNLVAWERAEGSTANWHLADDYTEVKPGKRVGKNSLRTKEAFGDFKLHLEFWVPQTSPDTPEQARGNAGVYLQGRYEVQILDSYERTLGGQNDAGAIYEVRDASQNASLPPETWQSYDIEFRAARFTAGQKNEDARVSVFWNGQLVQVDTIISGPTRLGTPEEKGAVNAAGILEGPIVLQDHGDRVRFRNIWLEPL